MSPTAGQAVPPHIVARYGPAPLASPMAQVTVPKATKNNSNHAVPIKTPMKSKPSARSGARKADDNKPSASPTLQVLDPNSNMRAEASPFLPTTQTSDSYRSEIVQGAKAASVFGTSSSTPVIGVVAGAPLVSQTPQKVPTITKHVHVQPRKVLDPLNADAFSQLYELHPSESAALRTTLEKAHKDRQSFEDDVLRRIELFTTQMLAVVDEEDLLEKKLTTYRESFTRKMTVSLACEDAKTKDALQLEALQFIQVATKCSVDAAACRARIEEFRRNLRTMEEKLTRSSARFTDLLYGTVLRTLESKQFVTPEVVEEQSDPDFSAIEPSSRADASVPTQDSEREKQLALQKLAADMCKLFHLSDEIPERVPSPDGHRESSLHLIDDIWKTVDKIKSQDKEALSQLSGVYPVILGELAPSDDRATVIENNIGDSKSKAFPRVPPGKSRDKTTATVVSFTTLNTDCKDTPESSRYKEGGILDAVMQYLPRPDGATKMSPAVPASPLLNDPKAVSEEAAAAAGGESTLHAETTQEHSKSAHESSEKDLEIRVTPRKKHWDKKTGTNKSGSEDEADAQGSTSSAAAVGNDADGAAGVQSNA